VVAGCASGPTIRSKVDPSVDFKSFRTFGFNEPLATDREGYPSLISQQLVWEGFALGRVTQRTTDNLGPVLDAAVVDIFSSFPLQP
jgi:hypothetical protein